MAGSGAASMIAMPSDYEPMSVRLLEISADLLVHYFGHTRERAEELTSRFLVRDPSRFNEDFIHHEMPWRVAAAIHYLESMGGPPNRLGDWIIESGNEGSPPEASELIRVRMCAPF
jgi:hypothetical protein